MEFTTLYNNLKKYEPNLAIKYKNESILMMIIGVLLFFNKPFMADYTTVISATVYFPSRKWVENNHNDSIAILAHEFVHIQDSKKFKYGTYYLLYLMPQILFLLIVPTMFLVGWWALLFMIFLAPFPSYFRKYFEFRGYCMSLFVQNEIWKERNISIEKRKVALEKSAKLINDRYFKGAAYYWQWPFGVDFSEVTNKIINDDIAIEGDVFDIVRKSLQ